MAIGTRTTGLPLHRHVAGHGHYSCCVGRSGHGHSSGSIGRAGEELNNINLMRHQTGNNCHGTCVMSDADVSELERLLAKKSIVNIANIDENVIEQNA